MTSSLRRPGHRGRVVACASLLLISAPIAAVAASPPVRVGGSSTVYPLVRRAISLLPAEVRSSVDLTESGTSAGFRSFCAGRLSIANASRPIAAAELEACRRRGVVFSELPVAFDAITVVVPAGNTWLRSLSLAQLARLWGPGAQGKVTHWNQIDPAWPKRPIKLCGPGKDSGTFDYFNEVVNGSPTKSRTDYTSSEDDAVLVKCVASHPDALGYFGFSYYASNRSRLRAVPLSTSGSPAVAPTLESVQDGRYRSLSRLLFVYVNDAEMRRRDLVRRLVTTLLRQAPQIARAEGVIPLSPDTYRLIEAKFYRHVPGTSFSGTLPVGMTIDQALQKSLESVRRPEYR